MGTVKFFPLKMCHISYYCCLISMTLHQISYNDQIKEYEMDRAYSMHGEKKISYRVLVRKPERKRQISRPRRMWEDNINTNLRDIRLGGMDWIYLAQDKGQ
jgi:hypothetical protein